MKSKALIAVAAGMLSWSFAFASPEFGVPSAADEISPSLTNLNSLDRYTGGYKGWGPMANFQEPYSGSEVGANNVFQDTQDRKRAIAEVNQERDRVWVANAPLRAPYEIQNIGATKAEAAQGMVRFNSGDIKY